MKFLFLVCLALTVLGQEADTTEVPFEDTDTTDHSINCGECIEVAGTFCLNVDWEEGAERASIDCSSEDFEHYCCFEGDDCSSYTEGDSAWVCSDSYSDPTYAKHVCPFCMDQCGGQYDTIELSEGDEPVAVEIEGLERGQSCFFKMEVGCGGGKFTASGDSGIVVEQLDFRDAEIEVDGEPVDGRGKPSDSEEVMGSPPEDGMPNRNQEFSHGQNANGEGIGEGMDGGMGGEGSGEGGEMDGPRGQNKPRPGDDGYIYPPSECEADDDECIAAFEEQFGSPPEDGSAPPTFGGAHGNSDSSPDAGAI